MREGKEFTCQLTFHDKSSDPASIFTLLHLRKMATAERTSNSVGAETDGSETNHQSLRETETLTPVVGCQQMTDNAGHLQHVVSMHEQSFFCSGAHGADTETGLFPHKHWI